MNHLNNKGKVPLFTGNLIVEEGRIRNDLSLLHARSLAEQVEVRHLGELFTGEIPVANGKITDWSSPFTFTGQSLIHSAPLSAAAFSRSVMGPFGEYIVTIALLLFAFSTAIAWSYYGDRAVTYLIGTRYVFFYRIIFVLGFFMASFTDTTIIWNLSLLTVAFMAIPNLIGLLVLHKEMKTTIRDYWVRFREENPQEKTTMK